MKQVSEWVICPDHYPIRFFPMFNDAPFLSPPPNIFNSWWQSDSTETSAVWHYLISCELIACGTHMHTHSSTCCLNVTAVLWILCSSLFPVGRWWHVAPSTVALRGEVTCHTETKTVTFICLTKVQYLHCLHNHKKTWTFTEFICPQGNSSSVGDTCLKSQCLQGKKYINQRYCNLF